VDGGTRRPPDGELASVVTTAPEDRVSELWG
jgi:hypothetical protein